MQLARSTVAGRVAARNPARRSVVVVRAASRPTWYPGATPPAHLDGTLAGDRGFDPLRLAVNKDNLKWMVEGELYNGRVAMMAVAGILFTDLVGLPKFWLAGAEPYWLDTKTQAIVIAALFPILEGFRYSNYKTKGITGFLNMAPFDPLNMRSDQMAEKEVKNARLAMLAVLGFFSQAAVYGKGPIDCLKMHLDDPTHNNIFTSSVGKETAVFVAVLSVWPIIIEASKSLDKKQSTPIFPWAEPWKN